MTGAGIFAYTVDHFLAPVMPFVRDPSITEIMINSAKEIYVEREGRLEKTDASFPDEEAYLAAINNVLQYTGKRLTRTTRWSTPACPTAHACTWCSSR